MSDIQSSLFGAGPLAPSRFPINSRYNGVEIAQLGGEDDQPVLYLRRRFVPDPANFQAVGEYSVVESDRLDTIAASELGDPELFWRLCDANGAMKPEDLTETVGTKIKITLPEGISGARL